MRILLQRRLDKQLLQAHDIRFLDGGLTAVDPQKIRVFALCDAAAEITALTGEAILARFAQDALRKQQRRRFLAGALGAMQQIRMRIAARTQGVRQRLIDDRLPKRQLLFSHAR